MKQTVKQTVEAMKIFRPAGEKRVRVRQLESGPPVDAQHVIEVNVSIDDKPRWVWVGKTDCWMHADIARAAIVRAIAAEVTARMRG